MDVGRRISGGAGAGINGAATASKMSAGIPPSQEGIELAKREDTPLEQTRNVALKVESEPRQQLRERITAGAAPRPDSFAKAPSTQPSIFALGSVDKRTVSDEASLVEAVTAATGAATSTGGTVLLRQQQASLLADAENGRAKVILARN